MLRVAFFGLFFIAFVHTSCFAQDTLPNILVKNYSGKIIISWKNNYGARISTLNVQRSNDSLKNFVTFASVLNPMNKQNGIVDNKAPNTNMFYRVFVAFEGGSYIFSQTKRPQIDIDTLVVEKPVAKPEVKVEEKVVEKTEEKVEERPDTNVTEKADVKVVQRPPSTLKPPTIDSFSFKAKIKVKVTAPQAVMIELGRFIFTGKDNNVIISLADATKRKYSIKFFDEKETPVLELKKITEPYLILDKVNFLHAGTFIYELYDNGDLLEKYRVVIPKDSKY